MNSRITPPPVSESGTVIHTRILLEIFLHVYAVASAIILVRASLRALGVDQNLWVTSLLDQLVLPATILLDRIPGAQRTLAGAMTLTDLTLLAGVAIVPLALVARGRPPAKRRGR
jgi:hypothetical protein